MLSKQYAYQISRLCPPQFTTIRPIHECEILTLQSDFFSTRMCTGEETFHTPLIEIYWTMVHIPMVLYS
jgi:hypothetical protein